MDSKEKILSDPKAGRCSPLEAAIRTLQLVSALPETVYDHV